MIFDLYCDTYSQSLYNSSRFEIFKFPISDKKVLYTSKIILIILVLYPLFFPIEDYFIHRGVSLSILNSLSWYFLAM